MNHNIFKAYDIRGLSPQELNGTDAKRIASALSVTLRPKQVVVGRDMRETSEALEAGVVEGFLALGVNVTKIGLCSTPLFNFAIGSATGKYDLGVMVTASHNPSEYNGLKITRGDNSPVGQGLGMEEVRDRAMSNNEFSPTVSQGKLTIDNSVLERYIDYVIAHAKLPKQTKSIRIAVDAGNGMQGYVMPALAKRLSDIHWESLYWDLDGRFPNHEANPLKTETLTALQQKVVQSECAFGAAFDGDGDRVGIVDEEGEVIPGSLLTALLAKEILRNEPGGHMLYDLRSSRSIAEIVGEAGGTSEMTRIGHAFIKSRMRETRAVFAGELSMHFYFKEFWNCEAGDYAMLLILRMILRENRPLSALWRPLLRYNHSGELNFRAADPGAVIEAVAKSFGDQKAEASRLDGLRLDFTDHWLSLRASNTEPVLRLNAETPTADETRLLVERVAALINQQGGQRL